MWGPEISLQKHQTGPADDMLPEAARLFRQAPHHYISSAGPESVPFLDSQSRLRSLESDGSDLEKCSSSSGDERRVSQQTYDSDEDFSARNDTCCTSSLTRQTRWRIPFISRVIGRRRPRSYSNEEKVTSRSPRSVFRRICRYVFISFMILGIVHFLALICGLYLALFPEEIDGPGSPTFASHKPHGLGHWPTDIPAGSLPIECASHNDYWRREPLFSALHAGCTGVEADVWLYNDDLFVGHNAASLKPERTLQSLYINPLLEILEKHNTYNEFRPDIDTPRNGVFESNPKQKLVLLIDYKKDGEALWPHVYKQLEPLRQGKYLTYFDGTTIIDGPIIVVATGNAPFHRIIQNNSYRDIFFDAPLDLMAKASSEADAPELSSNNMTLTRSNGGQGHSGAAPRDPNAYSLHNSYYASVSFKQSILGFPVLWRNTLSSAQMRLIREQIAGAHARGLKVRYWGVPEYPVSMRNYLWRVLVREGVDYLNVDDLKGATRGKWIKKIWENERGWWFG